MENWVEIDLKRLKNNYEYLTDTQKNATSINTSGLPSIEDLKKNFYQKENDDKYYVWRDFGRNLTHYQITLNNYKDGDIENSEEYIITLNKNDNNIYSVSSDSSFVASSCVILASYVLSVLFFRNIIFNHFMI